MSAYPRVILLLRLTPDGLARKTLREIKQYANKDDEDISIDEESYCTVILETDYDDGFQISGEPGDILIFNLVTYGYGESISWEKLENMKIKLEEFAKEVCEKFHCNYIIEITANYR